VTIWLVRNNLVAEVAKEHARSEKEFNMPTELVLIGGILVVAAGGLVFFLLHRHKTAELPHFR
jgi:hypothetical protein